LDTVILVLFSTPVIWSIRYDGPLVNPVIDVETLVPEPLVPSPFSNTILPDVVENSQTPIPLASTLAWAEVIVSLAAVVSAVSSSENQILTVTPSACAPLDLVYSYTFVYVLPWSSFIAVWLLVFPLLVV
jgi:hypothetical protein